MEIINNTTTENTKIYGEMETKNLFIKFSEGHIMIASLKAHHPDEDNLRLKRYKTASLHEPIKKEKLEKYKKFIIKKLVFETTLENLIELLIIEFNNNNEKINLDFKELEKKQLPSITTIKSNDFVSIRYTDSEFHAQDLTDTNNEPTMYLDVSNKRRRELITDFKIEFKFTDKTTYQDICNYFKEKFGGYYPFHSYCGID